jgi:hypothetical protein
MQHGMRGIGLAALIAVSAAAAASGNGAHVWGFVRSPPEVRLFFGVPDSHEVTLALICVPKNNRLEIVSTVLPENPVVGRPVDITLGNGSAVLTFPGRIAREREGFFGPLAELQATCPGSR